MFDEAVTVDQSIDPSVETAAQAALPETYDPQEDIVTTEQASLPPL